MCYAHPGLLHDLLLCVFSFARSLIEIASPTARRLRASTSTSATTSPASSSSPTLRHGEMAGTLGGARLRRRLHRRLVRTSTFAGLSSPSPTSPTVVSPHATRSDQPMCVIHLASVTSVLVERALHRARRAVAASSLRAAVASPRGLLRRCFLTAVDHVPDLIVDSSLRAPRMVFFKLYEFFAVSFERCRRVIRIIRPCAGKSGFPSSLRLAQPRRQRRHLVPDYFVYSSNSRRWHLLPRLLLRLRPPWRPSLLVPPGNGVWLCILSCTSGIGNTGACPSSPMCSRA